MQEFVFIEKNIEIKKSFLPNRTLVYCITAYARGLYELCPIYIYIYI